MRAASHTSTPHSMWQSSLSQTLCLCVCICVYLYLCLCISLSLCLREAGGRRVLACNDALHCPADHLSEPLLLNGVHPARHEAEANAERDNQHVANGNHRLTLLLQQSILRENAPVAQSAMRSSRARLAKLIISLAYERKEERKGEPEGVFSEVPS